MNVEKSEYSFLTAKSLKPRGWLRRQLLIQASGLAGQLDRVWPDVRDSKWIGGTCDGWERVPYWLDGFIPLAYLLEDSQMIERAQRYIEAIISGQQSDGWICPCTVEERPGYDMWALELLVKVLMVYYDCSGDARIPKIVEKALKQFAEHIEKYPLFSWGKFRWFELLVPMHQLYQMTHDDRIADLAYKIKSQGFDYEKLFMNWPYQTKQDHWTFEAHVVNHAMALKACTLWHSFDSSCDASKSKLQQDILCRDHGMAHGHFNGDEVLAGTSPVQGSELCGVVEAMYSDEVNFAFSGDVFWLDRLEKLAYNALPAACSPDMWTHQYDQQINQIACRRETSYNWTTNGTDSNLFGLEPNFGCCTADHGQGWPKFALSAFFRKGGNEILSAVPVPSECCVNINGFPVKITLDTDYPMREKLRYTIDAGEHDVDFVFSMRIPESLESAKINGESVDVSQRIYRMHRVWKGKTVVEAEYCFRTYLQKRDNDLYCLWRGPLLYSIPVPYQTVKMEYTCSHVERKYPYCDYELIPTGPWNYGFSPDAVYEFQDNGKEVSFDPEEVPVSIQCNVGQIDWPLKPGFLGIANPVPYSRTPFPDSIRVKRFIPYGATMLRMTEMPVLKSV